MGKFPYANLLCINILKSLLIKKCELASQYYYTMQFDKLLFYMHARIQSIIMNPDESHPFEPM